MSFGIRVATCACIFVLFATNLSGQANLATTTGLVTDVSEAAIPGADVIVRNTGTNIERTISTNEVGAYTVTNLIPGEYELTVQSDGFRTFVQRAIVL